MGVDYNIEMRVKNFPIPSDSNDRLMLVGLIMQKLSEVIEEKGENYETSVIGLKADKEKYTGRLHFPKIPKGSTTLEINPMDIQSAIIKVCDVEIKYLVKKEERLWKADVQILKIW